MNFSLGDLDIIAENYENYNDFNLSNLDIAAEHYNNTYGLDEYPEEKTYYELESFILILIILITCFIGLLGNGYIIWLLGFQIKRSPFTTFILNLAIADFGFLIAMALYCIDNFTDFMPLGIPWLISKSLSHITYLSDQFLLTAISIDRCVAVLFPIWHRCSRPNHLSTIVCALLWISSIILGGFLDGILRIIEHRRVIGFHILVTAALCFPLIMISTAILFIKVCLKPKQKKRGRLFLMILITLLSFLLLAFPLNVFVVFNKFVNGRTFQEIYYHEMYFLLCACLNCGVNPVIYFLVGRKKRGQYRESLKITFERVFKEDIVPGEEPKHSNPLTHPL